MSIFIKKVTIRNWKSIAACRIELGELTFLVGKNGTGKSNFLDALRFVSEALRTSLDHALRDRGTIKEVRRRSGGHPNHFSIRLDFVLANGQSGHYALRVGAKSEGGYEVTDEECSIAPTLAIGHTNTFRVKAGKLVESTVKLMPPAISDRLFLVNAAGITEFRPVYDALSRIEIYNLNPTKIAAMQRPDPSQILRRDGSNAASVFHQMQRDTQDMVREHLARIVPGIVDVESKTLGSQETIEFRQQVRGQAYSWRFLASAMSDGTLRAFGILVAAFQAAGGRSNGTSPLMIGLEEPEIALHPAAASVLLSALREGARHCQTIVTSHSPDLLDNQDIPADSLLAVDNDGGLTRIGPIDNAGRQALRSRLYTAGELLRLNQLAPDKDALVDVKEDRQLHLFDIKAA
jgi:predicted ATPase